MSAASAVSKTMDNGTEEAREPLEQSIHILRENQELIQEVHKLLKNVGVYEQMLKKGAEHVGRGDAAEEVIEKYKNNQLEELEVFEEAIQGIEDIIQNEEHVLEHAERLIEIIANLETAEEAEQRDIEEHVEKFKQTHNVELLEEAFREEIDAIENFHEEAKLAGETAKVVERAVQELKEIEDLEEIESKEIEEQESILRKEGKIFVKKGQKEYVEEVEDKEKQEDQQFSEEKKQTAKLVKLEEQQVTELQGELKRMLEEAKLNRDDAKELMQEYRNLDVEFTNDNQLIRRLQKTEEIAEQDVENIKRALDMLKN